MQGNGLKQNVLNYAWDLVMSRITYSELINARVICTRKSTFVKNEHALYAFERYER
jgi:hypothetical protein